VSLYQSHKNRIKSVVENTWGKNSAIEFKGWDKECTTDSDSEEVTKIHIKEEYIKENGTMNTAFYSAKNAMIVFYQHFNPADNSLADNWPAVVAHDIVHEFGHLLGFPHEHERLDTYRHGDFSSEQSSGSYFTDQSELLHICNHITYAKPVEPNDTDNVYYFNSEGEDKRRDQKLKLISYKDWQKSSYDPFSIMNYCEGAFDYQYMRVADSAAEQNKNPHDIALLFPTLTLSYEDKKRLQRFYGAPIADNQKHLLKNGAFFTGLFKDVEGDESSYRYYENGVKTKFYNTKLNNEQTDSINLSELTDDQYFYLHSSLPLANYKYNHLSRTYRNKTLYRYQKGRIFIEAESYPIAICDMDKEKPIDQAGGELNCFQMLDDKTHPNYSFYYFDGPYDLLRETQIQFCKKNKTQNTFTLNERSFSLIDTNRCYDFNPLKSLNYTTKQIRLLFVNGETFNGKLNGFSQSEYISLGLMKKDGLFNNKGINIIRRFEAQFYWNRLAKYLPETPDLFLEESYIRNIPFTGIWNDSGEKFFNNGIVASNFEQITHSYKWSHPQSNNQSINLQRQAIMSKLDDKLYMDGLLFTGEYKNKVYSKGIEVPD
jgi:small nuclear ribonucleoprotein (snRNP)-like protein